METSFILKSGQILCKDLEVPANTKALLFDTPGIKINGNKLKILKVWRNCIMNNN